MVTKKTPRKRALAEPKVPNNWISLLPFLWATLTFPLSIEKN